MRVQVTLQRRTEEKIETMDNQELDMALLELLPKLKDEQKKKLHRAIERTMNESNLSMLEALEYEFGLLAMLAERFGTR